MNYIERKVNIMKNLIVIVVLLFSVVALNAQEKTKTKKEKRAEKEARLVEQTKRLVEEKAWQFNAIQMLPSKGRSKSLTTSYSVVLKDGNVDSYLPYFGIAYSASYGGTDSPMIFKAPIEDYSISDGKKGGYNIKFKAKNKNDFVEYSFSISSNGSTTLSVNSINRQHISYYGDLVPIEKKEEE